MKKRDLKSGMVVEVVSGDRYVVFADSNVLAKPNGQGWMMLGDFTENLLFGGRLKDLDITTVYKPKWQCRYGSTDLEHLTILWRRFPEIKITVTVNGKEVPLSSISDETIKSIKNAEGK